MFQGVANGFDQSKNHYKDVKFDNDEIGIFLKRAFSKQSIIIYIISFLISMVCFGGDVTMNIAHLD